MSAAVGTGALAGMTVAVEIAWGADLTDADGSGWTWSDVTADVRQSPGISTVLGRGDEAGTSQPAQLQLTLDNSAASYSLGGHSTNYPYVRRGTPVRLRIDPDDGAGYRTVFLGFADGWTPQWDAMGAVPTVELSASGTLRRLLQGVSPLPSAYRRSAIAAANVRAYWPMEEAQGAQRAPAVQGGQDMIPTVPAAVVWGASSAFECSDPLPNTGGSGFVAVLDPWTATGQATTRMFVIVPEDGLVDGTVLAYVYVTGTLSRFDIVYSSAGTGNMGVYVYNSDGTLNSSTPSVTFDMNGNRRRLELTLTQSGGNVVWSLGVLDANPGDPGGSFGATVVGKTFGIVSQVYITPTGGSDGLIVGHLEVLDAVVATFERAQAFWAWQRSSANSFYPEFAYSSTPGFSRLQRLCDENGIGITFPIIAGSGTADVLDPREGLGPQLSRPLVDLLREVEVVDQGQLLDGLSAGLDYVMRREREDGDVALTINAGTGPDGGQLAGPFAPVDDDQRTRNRVTASRTAGARATYEDSTGPMGTAAIGVYDAGLDFNGHADTFALQEAAWAVSLGTVTGYRYPSLTVDLLAAPSLAGDVLDLIPGCRVQVVDADAVLTGFPAGTVDLIVEGIAHAVSAGRWTCTLRCSWASPWLVGLIASATGDTSDLLLRPDTSGSTLAAAAAHSATTLSVATATGPLWTTVADDYPLTLDVGGIPVVASACSGSSSPQTFTVAALELDRASGSAVKLWTPRPLAL